MKVYAKMHQIFHKGNRMAKRKKKEAFDWEDEDQEEIIWVSKSEIKRDAEGFKTARREIGELNQSKSD